MSTFREIELIESTIRHGRIYFSANDINFFPSDSFADRESDGHKGKDVCFDLDGKNLESDIRISSGQRISPRRSFARYLKLIGATEGGKLRITRTSDRNYTVCYTSP